MGSMLGGGGKGGSQTSSMPEWYESMAKAQAAQAQNVGMLPYMPWMGPDVAAASPQLQNAWSIGNQMSNAFGLGGGGGGGGYMPQQGLYQPAASGGYPAPPGPPMQTPPMGGQQVPGTNPGYGGGMSSWPAFNDALGMLEQYYPEIAAQYQGVLPGSASHIQIDPTTGQPTAPAAPAGPAGPGAGGAGDLDLMKWYTMRRESSDGYNPRVGPSDDAYQHEFQRLQEKFGDLDLGFMG